MTRKPAQTPERSRLAEAIEALRKVRVEREGHQRAVENAAAMVASAEQAIVEKTAALEAAKGHHVDHIAAAGDAGVNTMTAPAIGMRQARLDLASAEDDLELARSVLSRCEERLMPPAGPENDAASLTAYQRMMRQESFDPFEEHRAAVARAAWDAMAEHGEKLVVEAFERANRTYAEAVKAGAIAAELATRVRLPDGLAAKLYALSESRSNVVPVAVVRKNSIGEWVAQTSLTAPHTPACAADRDAILADVRSRWSDAFDALLSDPHAELPTL